ncbi:hydrogenase 4 subunit D [Pectobacterium betavasculorum]|uniref:Hydrogenase 4 subunit D n=1 Tax=Pectobacterium betavasculorum TaxID=55207 RepID=A0A093RUZ8_9GAMM|nr:hydrogenase 4 subunit D [Pectobacterium betavasculorum]KFX06650.1 hydrogenase 4 subunit D [Pectobacterium betavasculorum]KFX20932.1 hydrogenase 4 subunit D [Pectobacterium betavasculorum]
MESSSFMTNTALATLLLPFIGALLTACSPKRNAKWLCTGFALLATLGTLVLGWGFLAHGKVAVTLPLLSYGNVALFGFTVDRISTLIVFAVVFLGLLVSLYSIGYMNTDNREHPHEGTNRYYALLLILIGAMVGLVMSSTLLGQLLFFEITGGCSWALIGYYQTAKSQRSALKALLITHIASLGLFIAAATLFISTGTFALSALSQLSGTPALLVFGGILFAAWGQSAQLPLQAWLPDAMEAPTPASAYMDTASMVKVGVYIYARAIVESGHIPLVIGWIGIGMATLTIVYGFLMYLPQKDMKRLLAWSTITQLGYIFLALSIAIFGSREAFDGGIAYIFNHAFAKSLFFLVVGSLSYCCGTRLLPRLRGVINKLPVVGIGFCIAALAIAGVPPLNGFFSKFPIFAAGFAMSREFWVMTPLMVLVLIESVASFSWLIYWFGQVVPGEPSEELVQASPLPITMQLVLLVLIVMSFCSSIIAVIWLG